MKLVFIIWSHEQDGKYIEEIYRDKDKAEAAVRFYNANNPGDFYSIQEKAITE